MRRDVRKPAFRGFLPGLTQTNLCRYRRRLEALNFRFRKKRDCTAGSKNKGAEQLYCTADLHLCFRIDKNPVFSCCGSYITSCHEQNHDYHLSFSFWIVKSHYTAYELKGMKIMSNDFQMCKRLSEKFLYLQIQRQNRATVSPTHP